MNEAIKCLVERRSVRAYLPEQVKEDQLQTIIDAASYTASGHGMQPVKLVVVQNVEMIKKLSALNAKILGVNSDPFYGAPTVIVVLADKKSSTYREDGSLVMGNLMNAAHAIGVDSCWINRAREEFDTPEGKALLAEWGINGDYAGIGHCILGYRKGAYPQAAPRKNDFAVYIR